MRRTAEHIDNPLAFPRGVKLGSCFKIEATHDSHHLQQEHVLVIRAEEATVRADNLQSCA